MKRFFLLTAAGTLLGLSAVPSGFAQSDFRFYAGEGPVSTPLNTSPISATNPDYTGPALHYVLDDFSLNVTGRNNQYSHCQPYQDIQPSFGGLGIYSDHPLWSWLCKNDEVDFNESLTLQFDQEVELSHWRFFAGHSSIGGNVSANFVIDGQSQSINLSALQNDTETRLKGTEFILQGNGSGAFYLGGFQAESPEIIIELGDCDGDTGCTLFDKYGFASTITNAPGVAGKLRLKKPKALLDPRTHCGGAGWHSTELNLNELTGGMLTGDVILPAHLCGIPSLQQDGQYRPEITLFEVIATLNLRDEMINDEVQEPTNGDYQCASVQGDTNAPFTHPLLTWLPRPNTEEIPIQSLDGSVVNTVRTINIGCGSLRAGVGQRSYLIYNLHYPSGTDLRAVIAGEIAQLKATVSQAEQCMKNHGVHTSTMSSLVKSIESGFANQQYTNKVEPKLRSRESALNEARLRTPLAECYWEPQLQKAVFATPDSGLQPRNFRGDLLGQTLHLQYQVDAMILLRAQGS